MIKKILKTKLRIAIVAVLILIIAGVFALKISKKPVYNFVDVKKGDVSEEVIVTGKITPVDKLDLAFERAGKIARVYKEEGDDVLPGDILIELDSSELRASLSEALANESVQQAKLDELVRGTRPENIQIARTDVLKAQQTLQNEYAGIMQVLNDSYAKADDSVRNQISALFSNANTANPQLTFTTSDQQAQIDAQTGRVIAGGELDTWKTELATQSSQSPAYELETALNQTLTHLEKILSFLNRTMDAVISSPSSLASTYKTSVTTARSAINTAITNVNDKIQSIASEKISIDQAKDELALKLAGSTDEEISAQKAQLAQATASVAAAQARVNQTVLRSPIAGIITKLENKAGEIVSIGSIAASVISKNDFEIDANIPEVDIGKISLNNIVSISFDAFPDESFEGKVTKIDTAETIIDGVVNFKTVVMLNSSDKRLKSGLTANLSIETKHKTDVLVLPQEALVEKREGTFVQKLENGTITEFPVSTGLRDKNGSVEIVSGVSEGDRVVNIGLKTGA